jgi:hypothetical protein
LTVLSQQERKLRKEKMVLSFDVLLALPILLCCISRTESFQIVPQQISLPHSGADPVPFLNGHGPLLSLVAESHAESGMNFDFLLKSSDFWVFLAGIFPFAWATVEFWRRIAFGEPFGTSADSVVIGIDDSPQDSRGRRVLGKDALITAYILFALAFGTIGVVFYAIFSSDAPPEVFPGSATNVLP